MCRNGLTPVRPSGRHTLHPLLFVLLIITLISCSPAAALVASPPAPAQVAPQPAGAPVAPVVPAAGADIWTKMDLDRVQVTAVAVDPTNPIIIFAGTAGLGVFRSFDSGRTWDQVNNGLGNLFINDIVISPTDPTIILAATGRGPLVGDAGAGVYRSATRGDSWAGRLGGFTADLEISANPQIVYAAGGLVYRSANGGLDWAQAFTNPTVFQNVDMLALAVHPIDSNIVLVGGTTEGGSGSVFRTTNAGGTWTRVQETTIPAVLSIAFTANPQQAFFGNTQGVWRSRDGGVTWTLVFGGSQAAHLHADPVNANVLYVGTSGQGVLQTTNGGDTFVVFGAGLGNQVVRSLDLDRISPRTLWAGTDDGIWAFTFSIPVPGPTPTPSPPPPTATPPPPVFPTLAINPVSGAPGSPVAFIGSGFTAGGAASVTVGRAPGIVVAMLVANATGNIAGTFNIPDPNTVAGLGFGAVDVFATDASTNRHTAPILLTITRPAFNTAWFFAEGSTQPPFDLWYLVQNPTEDAARVRFTFLMDDGTTPITEHTVEAHSRFSLFVNQILPGHAMSALVESDQEIFAERAMFVGFDGHTVTGIPGPNTIWLFAEGSTQTPFHTWLLLQNPNGQVATASITYLVQGGAPQTQVIALPPTSRTSIFVNQVLPEVAFSTQVRSNLPIIVERSMFRFPGNAATDVAGVSQPGQTWFFAEGNTNAQDLPTDTWLLLQNPNPAAAQATITAYFEGGGQLSFVQPLPASTRISVFLNRFIAGSYGMRIDASAPIIAERSMFYGFEPRGASATVGSPGLSNSWHLTEGSTATPFDMVVAIMNPNAQDASLRIEFELETGSALVYAVTVPPQSKRSIQVDDIIPASAVSTHISSSVPIVVERTMFIHQGGSVGAAGKIGVQ